MFSPSDTIVAIATAPMRAGIGVVRVSGPGAHAIARSILTVTHDLQPRHATLTLVRAAATTTPVAETSPGEVSITTPGEVDLLGSDVAQSFSSAKAGQPATGSAARGRRIDEVVATFFPGPRSYTAEDVVEISAHGSLELLSEIVRAAMAAGARLAEPGEFTLRAFLNGRLDLVQAEAVADLVAAVTPLQARVAFDQLEGTLTSAIAGLDAELFELAAKLEASVDFPDEGYHFVAADQTREALRRVQSGVEALLSTAPRGRMIREGRHIAILGKPNVGKSSLFNELVGTDRAIVTALPGTTRDLLRETIDLDGIRLGLVDTAGIRLSDSEVEREGVVRARRAAAVADLVVLVLDQSRPMEVIDESLLSETAGNSRVVVANKADLASAWTRDGVVVVSLKTGAGVDSLRAAMLRALNAAEPLRDGALITNLRHEALLREAHASLARAIGNLEQAGESACEELVLADIADARRAFEEVTGKRSSEDLLAAIFERFCIGK